MTIKSKSFDPYALSFKISRVVVKNYKSYLHSYLQFLGVCNIFWN